MKLELRDDKGVVGTIELPLAQLKEELGFGSASGADSSPASEALRVDAESFEAQLKESRDKVGALEEQVAGRTMDDFTPAEKAHFVLAWGKGMSSEDKALFARAVGIPIAGAAADLGQDGSIIEGKTDLPGYKFYKYLNMSMKTQEA